MEIKLRHWVIALLVAALTHGAVALALVWAPQPQIDKPIVVTIELDPGAGVDAEQGGSGGGAEGAATAAPAAKTKPKPAPRTKRKPEKKPTAKPRPKSKRVKRKPEKKLTAKPRPKSRKVTRPKPKTKAPAVSRARSRSKKAAASKSVSDAKPSARSASRRKLGTDSGRGSAQKRGARKGKGAGKGKGKGKSAGKRKGGGKRAANYYGHLAAHLNRHKRYPSQARRKRAQGMVKVSFTIDRRGRVVSQRIVRSSGHAALDREVRAMLKRASPLPRIPAEMNRGSLTITLPIVFNLR